MENNIRLGRLEMGKFKSVELYDTFTMDHPVTGETIRVQAMEGNNVISVVIIDSHNQASSVVKRN